MAVSKRDLAGPATTVPDSREPFPNPHNDPVLVRYLAGVLAWHRHMRLLLWPNENPDVPMERLFVEPQVAPRWLSPEQAPAPGSATSALEEISRERRVVLLGDPGSGKSTLVSWIATNLATRDANPWNEALGAGRGRLVPLPMIIRELRVSRDVTWDLLFGSFVEQEMVPRDPRMRASLEGALERGQAMVLLDGLDEIGSIEARQQLREAVHCAMRRYPDCRWLMTSRVVGYDTVPFHSEVDERGGRMPDPENPDLLSDVARQETGSDTVLRYVAPFDNAQVHEFARHWFSLRDWNTVRADAEAAEFCRRIASHSSTERLSRVPQLLVLVALIYRVKAAIPEGRALLYEEITKAYLETIDRGRRLDGPGYPLDQQVRWLARVGFEMQRQRSRARPDRGDGATPEILIGASELNKLVGEAMEESGCDSEGASAYLDWVQRRSGLLLPRGAGPVGEERYAFLQLSFQVIVQLPDSIGLECDSIEV